MFWKIYNVVVFWGLVLGIVFLVFYFNFINPPLCSSVFGRLTVTCVDK